MESHNFIVLFYKTECGTIVHTKNSATKKAVGDHDTVWSMECFIDFTGTISLSN